MTTMTFGAPSAAASPRRAAFSITGLFARVADEWAIYRASRAMAELDDTILHDIGVARGEIDEAVRHGRAGLSQG